MIGVKNRNTYHPGQTIFREGERGASIFIVERGSVEIWRGTSEARVVLGCIPIGGVFGEMAIFDDGPRVATATAVEETVLIRISSDRIRQALDKADPVLTKLIHVMLDSTRRMARQLEALCRNPEVEQTETMLSIGISVKRDESAR
jgi:CRP/FNR family transcriptional regulator, cyclic AMP receptor protein